MCGPIYSPPHALFMHISIHLCKGHECIWSPISWLGGHSGSNVNILVTLATDHLYIAGPGQTCEEKVKYGHFEAEVDIFFTKPSTSV